MTVDRIVELLRASGADAWELTDIREEGWEFYFIRRKLDQNRAKLTEHIRVKVYKKSADGQFLGSAAGEIAPTASDAEAGRIIGRLLANAAYVKNPFYTLNAPSAGQDQPVPARVDPAPIARDFVDAMRAVPETATEDINSCELFASGITRRFVNSEGIDVVSSYPASMAEVVVNARREGHEIELYRMYKSGGCDREGLIRSLEETMCFGRDKLIAQPTPNLGEADVVFSTDAAREIYGWFSERMNAAYKVFGYSDWEPGKPVTDAQGDRVTLTVRRELPNSSENAAFDAEGAPVRDEVLIEDGVARRFLGGRQFSQYLKLEDSFQPGNFEISGGSLSEAELRTGRFLEAVEFSDFQVDPFNGDIAGEIRLAYWHDGDRVIPVSGGSVSGTMAALSAHMRFSRETRQYDNWVVPAVTRIKGVTVTGAE